MCRSPEYKLPHPYLAVWKRLAVYPDATEILLAVNSQSASCQRKEYRHHQNIFFHDDSYSTSKLDGQIGDSNQIPTGLFISTSQN